MDYIVRDEKENDRDQVRKLLQAAFPSDGESKLVDLLGANGKAIISLVATSDNEVWGYILFSPVTTSPHSFAKGLGLAPVAVLPDVQSRGIGSQLIRDGLRRCKELGFDYCVVLGAPKFYTRFGFRKASTFGLLNEYGADEEFMILLLSESSPQGLLQYAPEFAELSV